MPTPKQTAIPTLVRVKPGALDRMGVYAERYGFTRVLLLFSQGLDVRLMGRLTASLRSRNIQVLQGQNSKRIASLFDTTGFWRLIASDPFDRAEWLEAARLAPSIKSDFYTILSSRDCLPEIERALNSDPNLRQCFRK